MENTVTTTNTFNDLLRSTFNQEEFSTLHWTGTMEEYIAKAKTNPNVLSNSWMRLYNMIMSKGYDEIVVNKEKVRRYKFFSDDPKYPIFGLEKNLHELVDVIHAGALGYGPEKRVLLLHGPVGSSKSTICSLLKRGLERFSKSEEGALYSYRWNIEGEEELVKIEATDHVDCPIHEDPLNLIPFESRQAVLDYIFEGVPDEDRVPVNLTMTMCPKCQFYFDYFMNKYNGDINKVFSRIEVYRFVMDEKKRKGIGTFQPKDEKNQDATELTGDINFRKLGAVGIDSDPRCFNFDGEFQVSNRGMCEFIELLKLTKEFLYDLLGASQEKQVKPKKFSQMMIDEVLLGHTNSPEFQALQKDKKMEALRDRTIKIDIPYLLSWDDEIKVYKHVYNSETVRQHIAPHTLEISALWAICTRLNDPSDNSISLVDKARLYNGQAMSGWTEDKVKELRDTAEQEGMNGISARFVQNVLSNVLVDNQEYINVFMVIKEIEQSLDHYSLIDNEDDKKRYKDLVGEIRKFYDDVVKEEIQKALVGDEKAIQTLCTQYIDNITAAVNGRKIRNMITGREDSPNERLMRSIEEKINIGEQQVNEFRRSIVMHVGTLAHEKREFDYESNPQLKTALQRKLFEDTKDTIKLAKLSEGASVVDKDVQSKIDSVKTRLIERYGYNEQSASDVLQHASSIFARGDMVG